MFHSKNNYQFALFSKSNILLLNVLDMEGVWRSGVSISMKINRSKRQHLWPENTLPRPITTPNLGGDSYKEKKNDVYITSCSCGTFQ